MKPDNAKEEMQEKGSVVKALKGERPGSATKKGVNLLGIVQKLTEKRAAMKKDGAGGPGFENRPSLPSQANVPSKTMPLKAKGAPNGRPFMS